MQTDTVLSSAAEYRIRARRLLKQLHDGSPDDALAAARRFQRLRSFAGRTAEAIAADRQRVKLKHALAVLADELGYGSWVELKKAAERATSPAAAMPMYERGHEWLLNRWFARYEEARASLEELGGYLFPYRSQFFLCEEEGVRLLGLDPADPDWERIGFDWVEPADRDAWRRLAGKRARAIAEIAG